MQKMTKLQNSSGFQIWDAKFVKMYAKRNLFLWLVIKMASGITNYLKIWFVQKFTKSVLVLCIMKTFLKRNVKLSDI